MIRELSRNKPENHPMFDKLTAHQYLIAFNTLMLLRQNYPSASDAELLLFALGATVRERP